MRHAEDSTSSAIGAAPPLDLFATPARLCAVAGLLLATAAVTVLAVHSPVVGIGGLFVAALALAAWAYPGVALVALVVLLPFNVAIFTALVHKAGVHVGSLGDWKDALIVLLLIRGLFAQRERTGKLRPPRGAFESFLIAYVLFYCALALASPQLKPAVFTLGRDVEGPILLMAVLLLRPSRAVIRACLLAAATAALVIGVGAIYEHFGPRAGFVTWFGSPQPGPGSSFLPGSGGYRSGSFFDSPLLLAFYLAASAPVALGVAFAFRGWRILGVVAAAACVGGILASETRSGYIGGGVGIALVLALALRNRAVVTALIGVFLIAVAVAVVANRNNPTIVRSGEDTSKRSALQHDFDFIASHPLGAGLGTIDAVGQRFASPGTGGVASESTLLAQGYEGGVAGLLLYPASLFLLVFYLLGVRRRAPPGDGAVEAGLTAGAIGAVGAILGADLFLGINEVVLDVVVWGSAAFAAAWSLGAVGEPARLNPLRLPRSRQAPGG